MNKGSFFYTEINRAGFNEAALIANENKSGTIQTAAWAALDYGFKDIDVMPSKKTHHSDVSFYDYPDSQGEVYIYSAVVSPCSSLYALLSATLKNGNHIKPAAKIEKASQTEIFQLPCKIPYKIGGVVQGI